MAISKKKASGTDSRSTIADPLLEELKEIFVEYPDGVAIACGFLTTESSSLFIDITDSENIWRVRRNFVDRFVNGVSDRVELKWTKNNPNRNIEL